MGGFGARSYQVVARSYEWHVPGLHELALELGLGPVLGPVLGPDVAAAAQVELVLPVRAAC